MTSVIVIGKKELFSFAERYSSIRPRDYVSLSDGEILCLLFNQIFPQHAIRPAPAQTHSSSQRAQLNWESLYRRLVRVAIPVTLLDPARLVEGNAEAGFSALVLFYFLFHLTKRMDFSAEFALDLPDALQAFLQSIDCVASLLIGEAVEWSSVPAALGEQIRQLPAFHLPPQAEQALEEDAARLLRSVFSRGSSGRSARALSATGRSPLPVAHQVSVDLTSDAESEHSDADVMGAASPSQAAASIDTSCATSASAVPLQDDDDDHNSDAADKLRQEKRALIRHAADLQQQLTALRRANRQLEVERDALVEMEGERERQLASLRDENEQLRESHARAARSLGIGAAREVPNASEPLVSSLLEDVLDPETGDVVDVHDRANMLHCLLIEHLRDKPPQYREQGQRWLWSLLSAYHVLETRLVTAVEVISQLQSRDSPQHHHQETAQSDSTPRSHTDRATESVYADCDKKLDEAHRREHALSEQVRDLVTAMAQLEQRATRREELWRSLCTALHTAEQASFTVAGSESEPEVLELLQTRDTAYDSIENLTAALLHDTSEKPSCNRTAPVSPCAAVTRQVELLREENAALRRRQSRKLADVSDHSGAQGLSSSRADLSLEKRIAQQRRYEASERRPYRDDVGASSSSSSAATPSAAHRGDLTAHDVSPYAKSLLKLLTEASSPYTTKT